MNGGDDRETQAASKIAGSARALRRVLVVVVFAAVAIWSHSAEPQTLPSVPEILKPPAGEHLRAHAHASGQQIYTCDGSKWIRSGPDAKLFDQAGRNVGSHFAGPSWRWLDGGQVTGRPISSAAPNADSIPWLLLTATGHTGSGVLTNVSSIQRLQTKAGKAPVSGCGPSDKGEQARVPYTAEYYFYAP
ncbi:DUF3455 domain-containing protein [Candidatus Binatus sp.]|uniref:DUF3455 domain-containing protein n=1 Tax=Candidatus Binatus sp. TaxID=2811406 RepID=UPI003C828E12